MIHPLQMKASEHISVAADMLDRMGDADTVERQTGHANRNIALAKAAEAHIAMARFKLDYSDVVQKVKYDRPNTGD